MGRARGAGEPLLAARRRERGGGLDCRLAADSLLPSTPSSPGPRARPAQPACARGDPARWPPHRSPGSIPARRGAHPHLDAARRVGDEVSQAVAGDVDRAERPDATRGREEDAGAPDRESRTSICVLVARVVDDRGIEHAVGVEVGAGAPPTRPRRAGSRRGTPATGRRPRGRGGNERSGRRHGCIFTLHRAPGAEKS